MAELEEIGFAAEVVTVESPEEAGDPALEIGIANAFGACPCRVARSRDAWPACRGSRRRKPEEFAADVDRLFSLAEPERSRQTAEVADPLSEEGLLIPFAWYSIADYYSDRIGCQVASPGARASTSRPSA